MEAVKTNGRAGLGQDLLSLLSVFPIPPISDTMNYELVEPHEVSAPYHDLLVHDHHMTVTLEAHHGIRVDVRVLAQHHNGDSYARKIVLAARGGGRVVQFAIVRVHLKLCSPPVREEIVAGRTPLGRVLIQHNVPRRVEPKGYLRVITGPYMMELFSLDRPHSTYGRLAMIHRVEQPAPDPQNSRSAPLVEVLEVVVPEA
jgi:hypothetical protein